jgi:iron(III) transport system permease protein
VAGPDNKAVATVARPGASEAWQRGTIFGYSPIVLLLIGAMLCVMLPPVIYLLESSFYTLKPDGSFDQFTFRYYQEFFTSPRFLRNLGHTTIYALGSAFVALALGTLQAWIVERTDTPLKGYVFLFTIISLGIPSPLYTISFLLLLGKSGPINQWLGPLLDMNPVINVYTLLGMVVVEGIDFAPLVFLLLSALFRAQDANFEEASLMSGAGIQTTFREITLKLALPGIAALLILVFIRAFESFETPAMVGRPGGIYVLTTDIYQSAQVDRPPNYGQAGAFSVALLVIVCFLLYWYNRLSRKAERYQTITGKAFRLQPLKLGKWRYFTCAILIALFLIILVFPLIIVIWASFLPYYRGLTLEAIPLLTLKNYREVIDADLLRSSVVNTLILGAGAATCVSVVTVILAWFAARRYKGAWILDQLATAPLIFPSIVLGIALLQVFFALPFGLYGTMASLVIATFVRYMPYGMRYAYAGILQIHRELEEASSMSGARKPATFLRIVTPLVLPALITCWLFIFLSSTKSVSLLALLTGPDTRIVAVTIFDLWNNGSLPAVAALGCAWTAFMTVVSVIFYQVAKRYGLNVR